MITAKDLPRHQLLRSLQSTICPACGETKITHQSLCKGDYYALPKPMQRALYLRIDHGYAEALADALNYHDLSTLYWPPAEGDSNGK